MRHCHILLPYLLAETFSVAFICHVLLSRIPLPELKDSDKLDKIMYMKESTKKIRLGPENLPSICFYSFLNAYQVITRCVSDGLRCVFAKFKVGKE